MFVGRTGSTCRAHLARLQVKPNPKNAKETAVAVRHEGERVLKVLQPSDRVVLLDERGRWGRLLN